MQVGYLLVGEVGPVGEVLRRAFVGEEKPHEVGPLVVEQPQRAGQPIERLVPGQHVAEPVEQVRRPVPQRLQQRPDLWAYGPRHDRPPTRAEFPAVLDGRELLKVPTVGVVEPQRLGQRGEDARRRVGVPALFEPGQVLHADLGQGGQLRTPQAGRASPAVRG
ncbi:hypothetical protein GCM10029963_20430 [Micromonospora andamanensis]